MAWIGNQWYDPGQEPGTTQVSNDTSGRSWNDAVSAAGGQTPNYNPNPSTFGPSYGAPATQPQNPSTPVAMGDPTGWNNTFQAIKAAQDAKAAQPASSPAFQTLSGYNSSQYATQSEAQRLNQMLGGQGVINTRTIDSGAGRVPSQANIDFGGGTALNAGLLSERYAKYGKEVADRMTADELRSSGGGFNPTYQNTNPTMFNEQVSTAASPSFTPAGGGDRVTAALGGGRAPGTANPIVGGTPNPAGGGGGSQMWGGFAGPMQMNPFDILGGGGGGWMQDDPVSMMLNMLQGYRGFTGGPNRMSLQGFRTPSNGFGMVGSPLYNRARTALGYTRWQQQPMQAPFIPFSNGSWGQGVNPQLQMLMQLFGR